MFMFTKFVKFYLANLQLIDFQSPFLSVFPDNLSLNLGYCLQSVVSSIAFKLPL